MKRIVSSICGFHLNLIINDIFLDPTYLSHYAMLLNLFFPSDKVCTLFFSLYLFTIMKTHAIGIRMGLELVMGVSDKDWEDSHVGIRIRTVSYN